MSSPDHRAQERGWARVASAAAAAHQPRAPIEANRELFDAIEYVATEGRLNLRDLTDAYNAGAPELGLSDAWDAVEDYLQRISDLHEHAISRAHALARRAAQERAGAERGSVIAGDVSV